MAKKIIIGNDEYEIEDKEYEKIFKETETAYFSYRDEIQGKSPETFLERFFGL